MTSEHEITNNSSGDLLSGTIADQSDLQLRLATSNLNKLAQFQRGLPEGVGDQLFPLFDEEAIKESLHLNEKDGIAYATAISRTKLMHQREAQRREDPGVDYAIIVSDSIILIDEGDAQVAVNRDGNSEERQREILDRINADRRVTYVGAVSFGRKEGSSAFTVSTYVDVPLAQEIQSWPMDNDRIPDVKDPGQEFEAGYIGYRISTDGIVEPFKKPVVRTHDFGEARPYISGLTEEVKRFAHDAALFDRETASVVEGLISKYPFNTLSFYAAAEEGRDVDEFYRELSEDPDAFFEEKGGNCSLFTLALIERMAQQGIEANVGLYPALNKADETLVAEGHSAVLVNRNGRNYFFDPGLSVPFAVPYGEVPVAPFIVGDKSILVGVESDGLDVPDMLILKSNGRISRLEGQRLVDSDQFTSELPRLFKEFHLARNEMKIDYHGTDGAKVMGFSVDRSTGNLSVKSRNRIFGPIDLAGLSDPSTLAVLKQMCGYHGINDTLVLEELRRVSSAFSAE